MPHTRWLTGHDFPWPSLCCKLVSPLLRCCVQMHCIVELWLVHRVIAVVVVPLVYKQWSCAPVSHSEGILYVHKTLYCGHLVVKFSCVQVGCCVVLQ